MDLSGVWRAAIADDDLRRDGVELRADDADWTEVQVPGHWQSTPKFAASDGPLLYRRQFQLDLPPEDERRWVVFDGLCYQADVWLDGAYLGDPEGYFFPHAYDITDLARLGEEHVLAVELSCSPQPGTKNRRNITGILQGGIDPSWNPGGLWRPVRIESTGPVRIDKLRVLCRDANEARAHLRFHGRLDSSQARTVHVHTYLDGEPVAATEYSLAHGLNDLDWNIDIDEPRLWWPWSLGAQELVDIRVEVLVDGEESDSRLVRTGLREVALHDWKLSVNGERLFAKGANLLPTQLAIGDATPLEVAHDIVLAREAGLDLVRVHGHIARPELYDAADEHGVLIWQDFPLQWEQARQVKRQAVQQASEAVFLLGHHPSVAVWCAHNSPDGERTSGLLAFAASRQLPSWNRTVLDRGVRRAFERADDTRPVVAHSGVVPHLPQLDGTDSHLYFGWRDGDERELERAAKRLPRMVRFVSEFGAQAAPSAAGALHPERWPRLDWEGLAVHAGLEVDVIERLFPPMEFDDFESWRDATQAYQAQLLKYHIETLRKLKYRPTGGFCLFALNDSVPGQGWGLLDHLRAPRLAYHTVTEACRPVIVTVERLPEEVAAGDRLDLAVHVVSDLREPIAEAIVSAQATWPGGEHVWGWTGEVGADECVRVGRLRFDLPDELPPGRLVIDLTLEAGNVVATNRDTAPIAPA
jgi:beta-mannosidase